MKNAQYLTAVNAQEDLLDNAADVIDKYAVSNRART
jgi:hypothetical protein